MSSSFAVEADADGAAAEVVGQPVRVVSTEPGLIGVAMGPHPQFDEGPVAGVGEDAVAGGAAASEQRDRLLVAARVGDGPVFDVGRLLDAAALTASGLALGVGTWRYVYRAIDQYGQVIDVMVSTKRDVNAATRFFSKVIRSHGEPEEVTTDRSQALARTIVELLAAAHYDTTQYANNSSKPTTIDSRPGVDRCAGSNAIAPHRS